MERFRYGKPLIVIILALGLTGLPDDATFPSRPELAWEMLHQMMRRLLH